ncbi:hypothetical protein V1290_002232 [Bradyrhizobium sp. AZCC 1578]|uniref:hypothetical protein n=1 Tax=Bradyrhizobium sp. AZCC 1578 TaxID=3117027 RepID=UPI002FF32558
MSRLLSASELLHLRVRGMRSSALSKYQNKAHDVDSVTALVKLGLFTALSAYGSHWLYLILNYFRNYRDWL